MQPKKVLSGNQIFLELFLGITFYRGISLLFEIYVKRRIFYTPHDPFWEKII
jgi:hypothetical protein